MGPYVGTRRNELVMGDVLFNDTCGDAAVKKLVDEVLMIQQVLGDRARPHWRCTGSRSGARRALRASRL